MKRLAFILLIFIVVFFVFFSIKSKLEGLCGNYSLTYYKVKDLFKNTNIKDIKRGYNMHYNKDLYC